MCSYCGCDSIEVIGRFMAEHVEIINATGDLRRAVASGDAEAVGTAREQVGILLWPHTQAEEGGLFRVMARDETFAGHIETLCGEHRSLDEWLSDVVPGDLAAMERFENALREHIDKEDNGLFPAAAVSLAGDDWLEVHNSTPHSHGPGEPVHTHDHSHGPGEPTHTHAHSHAH